MLIGHLHNDVIWLQLLESFSFLFSCLNQGFCLKNLNDHLLI